MWLDGAEVPEHNAVSSVLLAVRGATPPGAYSVLNQHIPDCLLPTGWIFHVGKRDQAYWCIPATYMSSSGRWTSLCINHTKTALFARRQIDLYYVQLQSLRATRNNKSLAAAPGKHTCLFHFILFFLFIIFISFFIALIRIYSYNSMVWNNLPVVHYFN